jgi:signal transduction histidine kinase
MSLRTRLLLAFAAVVFIPIALLAFGIRQEMTRRLTEGYTQRLTLAVDAIHKDLERENTGIDVRLASLKSALPGDNRFRLGEIAGVEWERGYVLDYAGTAMRLTSLSMLQIQDGDGRIVSSGHFRNEHGRVDSALVRALTNARRGVALVTVRAAEGDFLALARVESVGIADRMFTLIGGVSIDQAFLQRLVHDPAIVVSLAYPGGGVSSAPAERKAESPEGEVETIPISLMRTTAGSKLEVVPAKLLVTQSRAELRTLLQRVDRLFMATAAVTGVTALLLAVWLSSRISRPLAALAEKTAVLDLDRLDVPFDDGTDEVGTLSRVLGDLAARLRASTTRIREAERRATVGDLARQINHDIKNGLIPLRNVMRHLAQVERDDPDALPSVLAERRPTVDSSIAYLETLATNYERLSPTPDRRDCDLNALIVEVVRGARGHEHVEVRTELSPDLPRVVGDPVAFRRILENLTANAVDSLQSKPGRVTVSTEWIRRDGEAPAIRVMVADTGRGISKDEAGRIFNDFYTTKAGGTGLGLSIVRRLVMDLHGTLRVESETGAGTRMIIDLPAIS